MQTSVGKGSIDWVKTFQAAKTGGVKSYFVEQTMELTRASVAALRGDEGLSQRSERWTNTSYNMYRITFVCLAIVIGVAADAQQAPPA